MNDTAFTDQLLALVADVIAATASDQDLKRLLAVWTQISHLSSPVFNSKKHSELNCICSDMHQQQASICIKIVPQSMLTRC
jgi:hypothetical protein